MSVTEYAGGRVEPFVERQDDQSSITNGADSISCRGDDFFGVVIFDGLLEKGKGPCVVPPGGGCFDYA